MQRLTAMDASFWYLEEPNTPMHVGSVALFDPPESGFDHERLVRLIGQRIAFVPRYRQRVREVPLGLGRPVWVDDASFDITYHVRRSALPRPGTMQQLEELVARLMSRPLDRSRPLWEVYLVEGCADGCVALVSKTHQAMVDGLGAVDLLQVLLDDAPHADAAPPSHWRPSREPSDIEVMTATITETLTRPTVAFDAVRSVGIDVVQVAGGVARRAAGVLSAALSAAKGTGQNPLNVPIGSQRRFATATFPLEDVKRVRRVLGGTVNDVLLAAAAGGLRAWLMSRGHAVDAQHAVRVLVPISTDDADGGHAVSAYLVELPTGEPDPIVRLEHIQFQMQQIKDVDTLLGADAFITAAGFGPSTIHALGARIGSKLSHRLYSLVVTNVPGPQRTLYVGEARMKATYPSVPLIDHHALSIALTSYDGDVFVGLTADRDAIPDLDVIRGCLREALDELMEAATSARRGPLRSVRTGTS